MRPITILLLVVLVAQPLPVMATCGGGGGGGVGGAGPSVGGTPQAYTVPWTVNGPEQADPTGAGEGLALLWFPASPEQAYASGLQTSRALSLFARRAYERARRRDPADVVALRLAQQHEGLIEASYNLAAIYSQLGDRDEALRLLRRHFYQYEGHDAVRAKEMREARDDIAFADYHADPEFVALTALADADNSSYHWPGAGE